MRKLSTFNKFRNSKLDRLTLNESIDIENEKVNIINIFRDFIDDGEKLVFRSANGDATFDDYLQKNDKWSKFQPVMKSSNKIVSKFYVKLTPKDDSYDRLIEIMNDMNTAIGRLGTDGWVMRDIQLKTGGVHCQSVKILSVDYTFERPYKVLDEPFTLPDEKTFKNIFETKTGLVVIDLDIDESETFVRFGSQSYDGSLPSEKWLDDKFEEICDIFGFQYYDYDPQRATVLFEYDSGD